MTKEECGTYIIDNNSYSFSGEVVLDILQLINQNLIIPEFTD